MKLRQRRHVHRAVECDDVDDRQRMTCADLVVGRVVTRRDLERTGAEIGSHSGVREDRNNAPCERQRHLLADERRVPRVVRPDCHTRVTEHRLGTHGGNGDAQSAFNRILQVIQRIGVLLPLDLLIADCGATARTPVDDSRPAIDEAFIEEGLEHEPDRAHVLVVEREPRALPVAGVSHPAHLLVDAAAVLLVPGIDTGLERGATQCLLGGALVGQLPFDDVLRGDGGVVGAWAPFHLESAHAPLPAQRVLDREGRCVSHVQRARDVRRWKRDDVCRLGACDISMADLELTPALAPLRFHAGPVEMLFHWAIEYMGRPGLTRPRGRVAPIVSLRHSGVNGELGVHELRCRGAELPRRCALADAPGRWSARWGRSARCPARIRSTPALRSPTKKDTSPTNRVPPVSWEVKGTTTAAGCPAGGRATLTGSSAVAPSRSGLTTAAAFSATSTSAPALVRVERLVEPAERTAATAGGSVPVQRWSNPDALLVMTCVSVMSVTAKKAATATAATTMARRFTLRPYALAQPPRSRRRDAWAPRSGAAARRLRGSPAR